MKKLLVALQVNEPYIAITHTPVAIYHGWLIMSIHICALCCCNGRETEDGTKEV